MSMVNRFSTIWNIFGSYRRHLVLLVVLGAFGALLEGIGINAAIPLLSFFTGGGVPQDPISQFLQSFFTLLHVPFSFRYILGFIIVLFLLRAVSMASFTIIRGWITADFLRAESSEMFRRLLDASWPFLLRQKIGYIHNTLVRDIQRTSGLFDMTTQVIQSATGFVMYFAVACAISPRMTLLSIAAAGGLMLLTRPLLRRTLSGGSAMAATEKHITQFLSEHINGMKLVKAGGVAREALAYSRRLLMDLRASYMKLMFVRSISTSLFQPFALMLVVLLFFVMYRSPGFSIVSFAATLYLIQKIFTYAESAQNALHGVGEVLPYARNVAQFKKELEEAREERAETGAPLVFDRSVELKNISLSYGDKQVLKNVSFTINKGEAIGLVGPSGAGKTSIADILLRLFVPQGEILIDDVPLSHIRIDEWRRHIAYVPQEVFLFNASVEENVRFYRKNLSHDDIVRALKQANIYETVMNLPEGLNTNLGDRGVMLSGGQRQRIALARALVGQPALLVLDEATSALDAESERLIQEAIHSLRGVVTVFIIAHRLSTIEHSDKVLVLDKGEIIEQGSPAELWANPDSYLSKHSS